MTCQLCEPTLLSRRDHVFGRRNYLSWAQFLGNKHEIGIECSGGVLKVKVDGEIRLVVKRSREEINEEELIGFIEFRFDAICDMVVTGRHRHAQVYCMQWAEESSDGGRWREDLLDHYLWQAIWKMNVLAKVKNFVWRACRDSLPTKTNLVKQRVVDDATCDCCKNGLDTKVEKSRKQMKERKNRAKKIRGVKKWPVPLDRS
uniref:Reverse transcriptase zinc-binding domain-containing protein n=1 Tax=Quercus lobata TaxID=97700 RepID=A0A7N2L5J3_QUELO